MKSKEREVNIRDCHEGKVFKVKEGCPVRKWLYLRPDLGIMEDTSLRFRVTNIYYDPLSGRLDSCLGNIFKEDDPNNKLMGWRFLAVNADNFPVSLDQIVGENLEFIAKNNKVKNKKSLLARLWDKCKRKDDLDPLIREIVNK